MTVQQMLRLSIVTAVIGLGLISCAYAQRDSENPCKNPEFGYAEEGFVNCRPQDAFARLNELAKHNDPKALYMLGRVYNFGGDDFGLPNVKQNYNHAMKYFVQSAELGYAEAQSTIALYYWRYYKGTRANEALYWWCRAAMQNDAAGVGSIQLKIKISGKNQTVQQYCAPILKSPPKQKGQD